MGIVNIVNRRALIRPLTMVLVLVCLLGMATLVRAQSPTPEEELADIRADIRQILVELAENNDYTHETLGKLSDDITANRDDISVLRLELGSKIDTSSVAYRLEISDLRAEVSQLRSDLIDRIDVNRTESREDMSELSSRIEDNRRESREDISKLMDRMNTQFLALLAAILAPTFMAALKGWRSRPREQNTGG